MKQHRALRRGLSVLILMLMCLTLLPMVALAEEPATETAYFFGGDDSSAALALLGGTDKATWNSKTKTLTLKGVNFTTSALTAVNLPEGATIVLADGTTNTITSVGTGGYSEGIYANGDLTIRGGGTLTVTSGEVTGDEGVSAGICADRNVTISGGTVIAKGGKARNKSSGIYAYTGDITITGGTVTATGGTASEKSYGIYAYTGDITISNGTVTANGGEVAGDEGVSSGIYAHNEVAISGGTVNATGGTAGHESTGIDAYFDVTISGGTVTAISSNASYMSTGIGAENMTISGGTVTAKSSNTGNMSTGIGAENMTISGGTVTAISSNTGSKSCGIVVYNMTISGGTVTAISSNAVHMSYGIDACYMTISGGHVIARTLAEKSTEVHMALKADPDLSTYTGYYWRTDEKDPFILSTTTEYSCSENHTYVEFTNVYTITLDPNYEGGESGTLTTGMDGILTETLPTPTREGYTFGGWYTAAEGGEKVDVNKVYTRNTTLYAHWTVIRYSVTVESAGNGTITASPNSAAKGDDITLTVTPDKGYALETLTALDKDGKEITLTKKSDTLYTFTMPASNVTVKAAFAEIKIENPFTDVPADAYYYDAVLWAVENGITKGTSETTFSPDAVCIRAQVVTFLWRAAGCPAPKSSDMVFTDVEADAYYYNAVLWAVEEGITVGTSETTFSPDAACTRAQVVTFLWRFRESPDAGAVNPFTDVAADAYYYDAVLWAAENGITVGTSATTFSPDSDCTRGQIVTFLYRCLI